MLNIYYLDKDPVKCAQAHYDAHVNTQCLEAAQILCTINRLNTSQKDADAAGMYIATHLNGPFVVWGARSGVVYRWLFTFFEALLDEHEHRFDTKHVCEPLRKVLAECPSSLLHREARDGLYRLRVDGKRRASAKSKGKLPTPPTSPTPMQYHLTHGMLSVSTGGKGDTSALHSHRNYYVNGESDFAEYTNREPPKWLNDYRDSTPSLEPPLASDFYGVPHNPYAGRRR